MSLNKLKQNYKAADGMPLELIDPSTNEVLTCDDGSNMTITLVGTDSPIYKNYIRRVQRNRGNKKLNEEQVEQEINKILSECTVDWNIQIDEGDKTQFTKAAVLELYSDPDFAFIREQALIFMGNRSNFFLKS